MKVSLYSVYDSVSGVYDGPVPCHNDGVAMRQFAEMANNKETKVGKSPSDFSLWKHGSFNDGTGDMQRHEKECIAHAVDFVEA